MIAWIALGAVILTGAVLIGWMAYWTDKDLREELQRKILLAAHRLDQSNLAMLSFTAQDGALPEFKHLSRQMKQLAESLKVSWPSARSYLSVYSIKKKNENFYFGPESIEPGDPRASSPGTLYKLPPKNLKNVFNNKRIVLEGPYQDEYGNFVSAFLPLLDKATGEVMAVIGMDLDAKNWKQIVMKAGFLGGVWFIAVLGGFGILYFLLIGFHRRPAIELFSIAVMGTLFTLLTAWSAARIEYKNQFNLFAQIANLQSSHIISGFQDLPRLSLEGLSHYFNIDDEVTPSEFSQFTDFLIKNEAVHAWEWVPQIFKKDRETFERSYQAAGLPGTGIWEIDPSGKRIRAGDRPVYYPVFYIEPVKGNEAAFGYDLGSEPARAYAIEEARQTRSMTAAGPITIVQETGKQKAFLVIQPVFKGESLRGFVLAVLRFQSMLENTMKQKKRIGGQYLSVSFSGLQTPDQPLAVIDTDFPHRNSPRFSIRYPLFVYGKSFLIEIQSNKDFEKLYPERAGFLTAFLGLILTVLAGLWVQMILVQQKKLEQTVQERTASLKESEESLSATLRSIGEGVISMDSLGFVTSLNAAAESMTGWKSEEALGKTISEVFRILNVETREPVENGVRWVLRENKNFTFGAQALLIHRSGTECKIDESCDPIHNLYGEVIGAVLVFRDVTTEFEARERIRKSEERLANVIKGTNAGTWEWNVKTGETIFNDTWASMLGFSLEELTPTSIHLWESFVHPEDLDRCHEALESHFKRESPFYDCEYRMKHKKGDWIWIHDRGQVISRTADGEPYLMFGTHMDITERKLAEERFQNQFLNLRAILNNLPFLAWLKDREGRFTAVNVSFSEAVGSRSPDDLVGKTDRDVWPANLAEAYIRDDQEIMKSGQKKNTEEIIDDRGVERWFETYKSPIFDAAGDVIGTAGFSRDITERKISEEAIRKSSEMVQLLLNSTAEAIYGLDMNGTCTFINAACLRLLGYERLEELLGKNMHQKIHSRHSDGSPYDVRKCPIFMAFQKGCEEHSNQEVFWRKDGTCFPVEYWSYPIWRDKKVIGAVVTFLDITERKQAEEALRESETNFHTFFDTIDDLIVVSTPQGRILYTNQALQRKLRYSVEEVTGKNVLDLYPQESRDEADDIFHAMIRGERNTCTLPLRSTQNQVIPVESRTWLGMWNGMECVFFISKDLTQEREASERFEKMFRNNPAMMALSVFPERRFYDVNEAFTKTLGYSREEILGKTARELGLVAHLQQAEEINAIVNRRERISDMEIQLRAKDQTIIDTVFSGEAIKGKANDFFLMVGIDISERKRAEKAVAEAAKAKTDFTGMVSHELRTPLTIIKEGIGIVIDQILGHLNEEQKHYLQIAKNNVDRLDRLITAVLDFQKLESGKMEFKMEHHDLHEILANLQKEVTLITKKKGLQFNLYLNSPVSKLDFDHDKIIQVLVNLMNNSVKFTEKGSLTVRTSVQGDCVQVEISDTGIGIKEEDLPKLFQEFTQIQRKIGGTGLGLSICKKIIEAHGGRIWAKSKWGEGTVFYFTLPIERR